MYKYHCFLFAFMFSISCQSKDLSLTEDIRFNQLGFFVFEEKVAIVVSEQAKAGMDFRIRNLETNEIAYSGHLQETIPSTFSDKQTFALSFSSLQDTGRFQIEVPGVGYSHPFPIGHTILHDVAKAGMKAFYYQRSAMSIEEQYAGIWHRPAGHPDNEVIVHPSAESKDRPAGSRLSSSKGWYDAGDYNKYIVNSGFTVGVLLSLYEDFRDYIEQQDIHIPESGNRTPDLLDEVYWNLAWMLTMQDPADGGVYHKLTTPEFEGFIKPDNCKKERYVVAKSVTAALDFAASLAQAARIYKEYEADYPGLSQQLLSSAEKAFVWAQASPEAYYTQNEMNGKFQPAIMTGEYGDRSANDEFFWAATELYLTTRETKYLDMAIQYAPDTYTVPVWSNVYGLGCWSFLRYGHEMEGEAKELADKMKSQLFTYADSALINYKKSPYHAPYGRVASDFFWGCNSDAASNQGVTFIYAWNMTLDKKYMDAALSNMDYILGRNATGYCYVTGYGYKSPLHPHHRLSASDDIDAPIPGFLVGGPNPGKQDGCDYPSDIPDECYADVLESYASNEIAINWQALFTYFSGALDAICTKY